MKPGLAFAQPPPLFRFLCRVLIGPRCPLSPDERKSFLRGLPLDSSPHSGHLFRGPTGFPHRILPHPEKVQRAVCRRAIGDECGMPAHTFQAEKPNDPQPWPSDAQAERIERAGLPRGVNGMPAAVPYFIKCLPRPQADTSPALFADCLFGRFAHRLTSRCQWSLRDFEKGMLRCLQVCRRHACC